MTRVTDALRRSSTNADRAEATSPGPMAFPPEAGEGDAFPQEARGIETFAHDPGQTGVVAAPLRQAEAAPPVMDGDQTSLFERLDPTLTEKVIVDDRMTHSSREQYRRLAAVLHDAQRATGLQVIMIASALPGEGKTLTASNLALTFSESYAKRVLLIDADLRRPTLHHVFRIDSTSGLSDGLTMEPAPPLTVRQISPRLSVLPAGRPSADPMAGLTSPRMSRLIEEAKATFDWVILDTPPLVLLPDAHVLASMVQGTVMVIKANSTPHHIAKRAIESVTRARIVGVVLNHASRHDTAPYEDQPQYYGVPLEGRA